MIGHVFDFKDRGDAVGGKCIPVLAITGAVAGQRKGFTFLKAPYNGHLTRAIQNQGIGDPSAS